VLGCADVAFGFAVPCADGACGTDLCVMRDTAPECHAPTTVCCDTSLCTLPPTCAGAASGCGTSPAGERRCTFLSDCPDPFPTPDAGVSPRDAGPPGSDAGPIEIDAGTTAHVDSGSPPDAEQVGAALPHSFGGGGGCRCAAAGVSRTSPFHLVPLLAVALLALRRHDHSAHRFT
jgi:MYXO-CTERM domain-containing protein